jgi:hypothetical protein
LKLYRAWKQPTTRQSSLWILPLVFGLLLCLSTSSAADGKAEKPYTVRVFRLWAVKQDRDKVPAQLKPYLRQLKKSSKLNAFSLAKKVVTKELREGQEVRVPLPLGYRGIWQLKNGPKGPQVIQRLVNPKKKESRVTIKKSPGISTLARVRDKKGVLVLLVDFVPTPPKKK